MDRPAEEYEPRAARPTGKLLVRAAWDLLRADRELMWLPVLGAGAALVALLLVLGPAVALGWLAGATSVGAGVGAVVGLFVASAVAIYFQAALVLGAFQRADGFDPSVRSTLRQVWGVRRQVVQWALLSTAVGTVIRTIEQRLGIVGVIIGFLGGLAWSIATFFAVPVLVAEGLGPIDATRRSSALIKQRWGVSLRSTLRVGGIFAVATVGCVVLFIIGGMAHAGGGVVVGVPVLVVAAIALLAVVALSGALMTYTRALLYRFAVGLPVPGIPAEFYRGAFVAKRRRWFGR